MANARSQENEMDKWDSGMARQKEIRDCCAHVFTGELSPHQIPDRAFPLDRQTVFQGARLQPDEESWTLCLTESYS